MRLEVITGARHAYRIRPPGSDRPLYVLQQDERHRIHSHKGPEAGLKESQCHVHSVGRGPADDHQRKQGGEDVQGGRPDGLHQCVYMGRARTVLGARGHCQTDKRIRFNMETVPHFVFREKR